MFGNLIKIVSLVLGFVVLAVGIAMLLAFPTMWLCNYLFSPQALTAVFGAASLPFWKAFWLNFFFAVAFKSSSSSKS